MKKLVCVALSLISVIVLFAGCTPEKNADSITTEATTVQTTQTVPTTQNTTTETTRETTAPTTAPTTKPTTPKPTTPKPTTPKPTEPKPTEPKAKVLYSGKWAIFTTWEIDENGVLTLSCDRAIQGASAEFPWAKYADIIKKIVFQEGVTGIPSEAFRDMKNVTSIEFANSIETIGNAAFAFCTGLKSIKIAKNIKTIEYGAFSGCTSLKSISFASGCKLATIEERAFFESGLTEFKAPASLRTIDTKAFAQCKDLEYARLDGGVAAVGHDVFEGCYALKHLILGSSITSLGQVISNEYSNITTLEYYTSCNQKLDYMPELTTLKIGGKRTSTGCFQNCTKLSSVTLASTITEIDQNAFRRCSSLTGITLPSSLKKIGREAFFESFIHSITIPAKVTELGYLAFANTPLRKVIFKGDAPKCESNNAFNGVRGNAYYPAGNKTWTKEVINNFSGAFGWFPQ